MNKLDKPSEYKENAEKTKNCLTRPKRILIYKLVEIEDIEDENKFEIAIKNNSRNIRKKKIKTRKKKKRK